MNLLNWMRVRTMAPVLLTLGLLAGAAHGDDAEPLNNTIRWATASEINNFGYDVYRGPTEEGPFERITSDPIPGAGTTDEPQRYAYVDDTIEPDTAYFYYVESIALDGTRERFTPIFKSRPKPAPATEG